MVDVHLAGKIVAVARNRLADDFLGQVAKNALRAAVPTRDDAIEVLADDCIFA